jgi:UDPglucose 6-dehydrogenase
MNLKVGIIGVGFVGNAMLQSFNKNGYVLDNNLYVYDKYKDTYKDNQNKIIETDIVFIALPTLYNEKRRTYNLDAIHENLDYLKKNEYNGLIVIKSTVEPTTCEELSQQYNLEIVHNPEFLTARTAFEDFHNQKHIVLGKTNKCNENKFQILKNFYQISYPSAEISICKSTESESMKNFLNSFYAIKVQFFTELYLLCDKLNISYDKVKELMLKNGWINSMHTSIPGPDGEISYGGMCFPKDTNALLQFMIEHDSPHGVLENTIKERNEMRND